MSLNLISLCRGHIRGEVLQTWACLHRAGKGFQVTQLPGTVTGGSGHVSRQGNDARRVRSGQLPSDAL